MSSLLPWIAVTILMSASSSRALFQSCTSLFASWRTSSLANGLTK